MPEQVSAVVAEIIAQGGLDASQSEVLAVLNRRHRQACARAQTPVRLTTLTTAGPGVYTAPAGLVQLLEMWSVAGGAVTRYSAGRRADLPAALNGTLLIDGPGLYFEFPGVTGLTWMLYPNPGTAAAVEIVNVTEPAALLVNDTVPFLVDGDMIEGLMAGVFSTLLSRPGEARPDLAVQQEQIFSAACEEFRLRLRTKTRGIGVKPIRIAGINA